MNAIVARFAIRGRIAVAAEYEAFRRAMPAQKARKHGFVRTGSVRWTGSAEVVEAPSRFAA